MGRTMLGPLLQRCERRSDMSELSSARPNLDALPDDLPRPIDDGMCDHLTAGFPLPSVPLPATDGSIVDLSTLSGRSVIFIYPRTGQPGQALPDGWNDIPGARGCTPQSCRFRDLHDEFAALRVRVFGLSTQSGDYQGEAVERLQLPYPLLSDESLLLTKTLALPTFAVDDRVLNKRVTLVANDGAIERAYYPVFPPDKAADRVLSDLVLTAY